VREALTHRDNGPRGGGLHRADLRTKGADNKPRELPSPCLCSRGKVDSALAQGVCRGCRHDRTDADLVLSRGRETGFSSVHKPLSRRGAHHSSGALGARGRASVVRLVGRTRTDVLGRVQEGPEPHLHPHGMSTVLVVHATGPKGASALVLARPWARGTGALSVLMFTRVKHPHHGAWAAGPSCLHLLPHGALQAVGTGARDVVVSSKNSPPPDGPRWG